MKRYGIPLIVIFAGSFVLSLLDRYLPLDSTVIYFLKAMLLFIYGVYLSTRSRKSSGWVKKFVVAGLFVLVLLFDLGLIRVALLSRILSFVGVNSIIYAMLYIYFGYIFF
ncbi:MAG TPA: hypothetical protein PLI19_05270 [Erysipelotrichaceae bacterium]|nr:hypothetical protein [Erysipelotrichaceae bacterium]